MIYNNIVALSKSSMIRAVRFFLLSRCLASCAFPCLVYKRLSFVGWLKRSHLLHLIKKTLCSRKDEAKKKEKQDLLVSGITLTSSNDGNTQQLFELRSSNQNSTNILLRIAWGESSAFIGSAEKKTINQMVKYPVGIYYNYDKFSFAL